MPARVSGESGGISMEKNQQDVDLIEVRGLDDIPEFASEAGEAAWWSTHELSAELWRPARSPSGRHLALELPAPQQNKAKAASDRKHSA
jgi:hypothetical protein